jgi:hypothetical protein
MIIPYQFDKSNNKIRKQINQERLRKAQTLNARIK